MNVNYVTNPLVKRDSYDTTLQSMKLDSGIFVLADEGSNITTKYTTTVNMHTIKVSVYRGIVIYVNCVYWHDSAGDNDDFCVYSALNVLHATYLISTMFVHAGTVSSPCQKLVKCYLLATQVHMLLQLYFYGITGLLIYTCISI